MSKLTRFEDMEVWRLARALARKIHDVSESPQFLKDYALRDQIRRASVSIISNIAEGFESQSNPVFCRYLASARGSAAEVRAQLYLAYDWGYITRPNLTVLVSETESISRQLTGFIHYLQNTSRKR